jgi:hypothetical protein
VIGTSNLDLKWIPKKEQTIVRGNLGKMPKVSTLGENEKHI